MPTPTFEDVQAVLEKLAVVRCVQLIPCEVKTIVINTHADVNVSYSLIA